MLPSIVRSKPPDTEPASRSDQDLLLAVRGGDHRSLDELIRRKARPLVRLAYRLVGDREEARDIAQLTFLRVWERRQSFDDRYSANTWLYRIATNLAIDHLRARQSRRRLAEPYRRHQFQLLRGGPDGELARLGRREVERILRELAAELSERQQTVFVLREIEGLSSREVAAIVGCRESTVRNHLFAARRHLRRQLRSRYPEYAPAGGDGE